MKKTILTLFFLICSCKSITYQDVNPTKQPNSNLLPALESVVDINNLESVYTSGSYQGSIDNFGSAYGTGNWGGWLQTSSINGTHYKDSRVNDVINVFNKEVKENISSPYGTKKGYIVLKLGYRGNDHGYQYMIPSLLSLGTLNILGFPADKITQSLEIEVEIWNNKKELVKRYVENVLDYNYVAMYWGYRQPVILRKVAADNIKQGLEKIRYQINNDAAEIKQKLK